MYFHYTISVEVLTGCGSDTRTEILEEGFIEASNAEAARQQVAVLGPGALQANATCLDEIWIGPHPTRDDLTIEVTPFELDARCAETRWRIRAIQELDDPERAPDAHLEMAYEDRNGCGVEGDA